MLDKIKDFVSSAFHKPEVVEVVTEATVIEQEFPKEEVNEYTKTLADILAAIDNAIEVAEATHANQVPLKSGVIGYLQNAKQYALIK
jgi:hypothetical protein